MQTLPLRTTECPCTATALQEGTTAAHPLSHTRHPHAQQISGDITAATTHVAVCTFEHPFIVGAQPTAHCHKPSCLHLSALTGFPKVVLSLTCNPGCNNIVGITHCIDRCFAASCHTITTRTSHTTTPAHCMDAHRSSNARTTTWHATVGSCPWGAEALM